MEELQDLVASSRLVRALGTGHSFSRVADTTGRWSPPRAGPPLEVLGDDRLVVVPGGATYARLTAALHEEGWAAAQPRVLPHISVAGACSTGTHGSGNANGSLSTAVAAGSSSGRMASWSASPTVTRSSRGPCSPWGAWGSYPALAADRAGVRGEPGGAHRRAVRAAARAASTRCWRWRTASVCSRRSPTRPASTASGSSAASAGRRPGSALLGEPSDTVPGTRCPAWTPSPRRPSSATGPWHHRLPHFRPEFTPSAGEELQSEYFLAREHAAEAFEAVRALAALAVGAAAGLRGAHGRG